MVDGQALLIEEVRDEELVHRDLEHGHVHLRPGEVRRPEVVRISVRYRRVRELGRGDDVEGRVRQESHGVSGLGRRIGGLDIRGMVRGPDGLDLSRPHHPMLAERKVVSVDQPLVAPGNGQVQQASLLRRHAGAAGDLVQQVDRLECGPAPTNSQRTLCEAGSDWMYWATGMLAAEVAVMKASSSRAVTSPSRLSITYGPRPGGAASGAAPLSRPTSRAGPSLSGSGRPPSVESASGVEESLSAASSGAGLESRAEPRAAASGAVAAASGGAGPAWQAPANSTAAMRSRLPRHDGRMTHLSRDSVRTGACCRDPIAASDSPVFDGDVYSTRPTPWWLSVPHIMCCTAPSGAFVFTIFSVSGMSSFLRL